MYLESVFRIDPNWSQIGKIAMTSQISDMTSSSFFHIFLFVLSSLVTCLKFKIHVNVITGSGVVTLFFIMYWPEIRKLKIPSSEFCLIFGTNDSNKMLLNTAKWQGYSLQKTNSRGRGLNYPPTSRLGLMDFDYNGSFFFSSFMINGVVFSDSAF